MYIILFNQIHGEFKFKSDEQLDDFLIGNIDGTIDDEKFQFSSEEWELAYSEFQSYCILSLTSKGEGDEEKLLVQKGPDSKDVSKIESGDSLLWMTNHLGLFKKITDGYDKAECIKLLDSVSYGLPQIVSKLQTNLGMQEDEIKNIFKSLTVRFVKYDLPHVSINDEKDHLLHEGEALEMIETTYTTHDHSYIFTIANDNFAEEKVRIDSEVKNITTKTYKFLSEYCQGIDQFKAADGFFKRIWIWIKKIFVHSESDKIVISKLCDVTRFSNVIFTVENDLKNLDIKALDSIPNFNSNFNKMIRQNLRNVVGMGLKGLFVRLFEDHNMYDKNFNLTIAMSDVFEFAIKNGNTQYITPDDNPSLKNLKIQIETLINKQRKIFLGETQASNNPAEQKVIQEINDKLQEMTASLAFFTSFNKKAQDLLEKSLDILSEKLFEKIKISSILQKNNMLLEDGNIDVDKFLKWLVLTKRIPTPEYYGESKNIDVLDETRIILV